MKFTLAIALLFTSTLAFADHHEEKATDPAATPMTKENTKATAKKRLRHMGKNIENMGDKAGKKMGVKDVHESHEMNTPEVPAPTATPAH